MDQNEQDTVEWHDVVSDHSSNGVPRLSCRDEECRGATTSRHHYMSDAEWRNAQTLFLCEHPCRNIIRLD